MAGLDPAIHVFNARGQTSMPGTWEGESTAVLRTAMAEHDDHWRE
jgi:hypothetical protein